MRLALLFSSIAACRLLAEPLSCWAPATLQGGVRATGFSELVQDIVVHCAGGTPSPAGTVVPPRTITVTSLDSIDITSRDLAASPGQTWTETFAIIDDPPPASQNLCTASDNACVLVAGGAGTYANQPNIFQGRRLSPRSIAFTLPLDEPGTGRIRKVRLVNFRINANNALMIERINTGVRFRFQVSGTSAPVDDIYYVALASPAIDLARFVPSFLPGGSTSRHRVGTLTIGANFEWTLRRRSIQLPTGNPDPALAPTPGTGPSTRNAYPTALHPEYESGFHNSAFPTLPGRGNLAMAGLADSGTRLMARFRGIPTGMNLWVPAELGIVAQDGRRVGTAAMTATDRLGAGTFTPVVADNAGLFQLAVNSGEAVAVWEVANGGGARVPIDIYAQYPAGSSGVVVEGFLASARSNATLPYPSFSIPGGTESNCPPGIVSPPLRVLSPLSVRAIFEADLPPGCAWTQEPPDSEWLSAMSGRDFRQGRGFVAFAATAAIGAAPARTVTVNLARTAVHVVQPGPGQSGLAAPALTNPAVPGGVVTPPLRLSWLPVAGATGYVIEAVPADLPASKSILRTEAESTAIPLSLPYGQWTVSVRACRGGYTLDQCGPDSRVSFFLSSIESPNGGPEILTPPASATLTSSTNAFRWNPVPRASWYQVSIINTASQRPAAAVKVDAPATSTILTLPSGRYQLWVSACSDACATSISYFDVSLPPVPALSPVLTRATVTGGNTLDAAWSSVAGADLYQVQVVQPGAGPGGGALTVAARQVSATAVQLPVPAGPASVLVSACNGVGCGPLSAPVPIQAVGPNPPAPVIGTPAAGTFVQGPAVLFSWSRVPGDNGSNTTYRLYVADLSIGTTAADVYTRDNFAAASFYTDGRRYDAVIVANPGLPSETKGPPAGFQVNGRTPFAPTLVTPAHGSRVDEGLVRIGWAADRAIELPPTSGYHYQYYVTAENGGPSFSGTTPGVFVELPLTAVNGRPVRYSAIVRRCEDNSWTGWLCFPDSDAGWLPWSHSPGGSGVTTFTVVP